jgi:hypothetical protein
VNFDVLTIGESIVDNGYFLQEPLVVVKENNQLIAVEGNRRLAALKLLFQPEFTKASQNAGMWSRLSKKAPADAARPPVVVYGSRKEVTNFLGYRHIAGTLKWDPPSKARFIAAIVEGAGSKADFKTIAQETGSSESVIRNYYITERVLAQAKAKQIDTSGMERNLAVFYRALSSRPIVEFLGIKKNEGPESLRQPVPKPKIERLEEVIGYIHGSGKSPPVITDSRQLTMLGEVLESSPALENLRIERNLLSAYQLTSGEEKRLIRNLERATISLRDALKDSYRYKNSNRVKELVKECVQAVNALLRDFPEENREA